MQKLATVNDLDEIICDIGRRFREERDRLGLNQRDLAHQLQTSHRTIVSYEASETQPKLAALTLFHRLGADIGYILTGQRTAGDLAPDEATLVDNYRNASPDSQSVIRKVGSALAKQDDEMKLAG